MLHNTYPDKDNLWSGYKRLKYVPFNPVDKFTMAVVEDKETGKVRYLQWLNQHTVTMAVERVFGAPCGHKDLCKILL